MNMFRIKITLGSVIRLIREQKGLSQEDLGMNKVSVSKIEADARHPRPETLAVIAKSLGVTVAEIYAELDRLNRAGESDLRTQHKDVSPEHIKCHDLLDVVLHGKTEDAEFWRQGVLATLLAFANSSIEPRRGQISRLSKPKKIDPAME